MTSEIHGGWTMENCKQALNEFCVKNRFPPREYKTSKDGTTNSRFICIVQRLLLQISHLAFNQNVHFFKLI